MSQVPRRVIIDTDPSAGVPGADVDDVLALAWALGCPELAIEGITVVAGNVELAEAVPSALCRSRWRRAAASTPSTWTARWSPTTATRTCSSRWTSTSPGGACCVAPHPVPLDTAPHEL